MIDIFSRHRPLALLASVVLAQVLLLAFQIKRDRDVRLIRYWTAELMTPLERGGTWTFSRVGNVWTGYIDLHNARADNERLRDEVGRLELRNRELESQAAEAQRLTLMLNFREVHPEVTMLAAQVIGASADPSSHTLFINRGERDHLRRNLGVITPDGVVGKIVEVFPTTAQVLLMNDKVSGVGVLFAGTRTHGVVKGDGDPDPRMDYVVNDEKVQAGEVILTSGEDRIFPKGLLVGTVSGAAPGNPFQVIRVHPAARLDRLEDVIVLLSQQELEPRKPGEPFSIVPEAASPDAADQSGVPSSVPPNVHPGAPSAAGTLSAAAPRPVTGASLTATKPQSPVAQAPPSASSPTRP